MGSTPPHLSDIDGDSAANASGKAVIGEVPDLCAVEQTAAHLSDSCQLSDDPESRLHRLKTFPGSLTKTATPDALQMNRSRTLPKPPLDSKEPHGLIPAPEGGEAETFTLENEAPPPVPVPVDSSERRSPSPQRKRCCFCFCWRKKAQRRKGKGDDASSGTGRAVAEGGAEEAGEGDAGNRGDGEGGTDKTTDEELK